MRSAERAVLLAAVMVCLAACSLDAPYLRVRVEMPSAPAVKIEDYRELVVSGFFLPSPAEGVDLDGDLSEYFRVALARRFKGSVTLRGPAPDLAERLKEEAFWKQRAGGAGRVLFLTGKARLDQEVRKALLGKERSSGQDPFDEVKTWDERKSFTLQATLLLIDGTTGRPVFEKEYKETASFANIKQPAPYALFDIMQRLKVKFFRSVFGADRIQERYLLF